MKLFRFFPSLIIIFFSITGFLSSMVLQIEKIHLLENPDIKLSCSINTTFNCASVMKSWQSEIFGFSNPLLGIAGYSITGVIGFYFLLHKKNIRLFKFGLFFGGIGAFIFSYWLLYQSVFVIHSICPYCLISCISATNIFVSSFYLALKENYFSLKGKLYNVFVSKLDKGWIILPVSLWYFGWIITIYFKYYFE